MESCEDGVMMMTSPLTAKVGLWDTAREEKKREEKRRLQPLNATFLQLPSKEKRVSLSHFKIISSLQTFNSCRLLALNPAEGNRKRMRK